MVVAAIDWAVEELSGPCSGCEWFGHHDAVDAVRSVGAIRHSSPVRACRWEKESRKPFSLKRAPIPGADRRYLITMGANITHVPPNSTRSSYSGVAERS